MILNEVARIYNEDSECVSTEDMIAAMERLNTRNDTPELFIGSMDVRALYPSLLAIPTAEIVTKVFTEVDIKIKGSTGMKQENIWRSTCLRKRSKTSISNTWSAQGRTRVGDTLA